MCAACVAEGPDVSAAADAGARDSEGGHISDLLYGPQAGLDFEGDELLEMFITKNSQGALLFLSTTSKEFSVISIFGNIDKTVVNAAMTGGIKVK